VLYATKENKRISSFGKDALNHDAHKNPIVAAIKYSRKFNGFGRHAGLESRNLLRASVWPTILAPMTTSKTDDNDALFFFIREYFMRNSNFANNNLRNNMAAGRSRRGTSPPS
jgi:hypothetical protein